MTKLLVAMFSVAVTQTVMAELEPVDDAALSDINGAGMALMMEGFSFDSSKAGNDGQLDIKLNDFNVATLKNIKIYKSGTNYTEGANIGSVDDPIRFDVTEETLPDGSRADIAIISMPGSSDALDIRYDGYYTPIDAINNTFSTTPEFFARWELSNFKFQQNDLEMWGDESGGLCMASTISMTADSLNIGGNEANPDGSPVQLNGVVVKNLVLGSKYQPLRVRTVESPAYYLPEGSDELQFVVTNNLQLEVEPLTQATADKIYTNPETGNPYTAAEYRGTIGSIEIQSLAFADQPITGYVNGTPQYAFQPDAGNVVDVQGLEIQSLEVTTHDLSY